MKEIEKLSIDTIRILSAEMVEKAQSGHPGTPLGAAPIAYTLWANHLNFTHSNREWINRDRFVLSSGHASPLLYSLLHLFRFDLEIEDLKKFRQFKSKTPGHPEYGYTDGVEATTGPLGAGLSMAVGMAIAQKSMAENFNTENYTVFDNHIFVLVGDGCLMEGITSEASSLAGTLMLDNLIVLYDSNAITIDGSTDLSFKEDVRLRYQAYGFETYLVQDANDVKNLNETISKAKKSNKPAFIEIKSKIGFGSLQEASEASHGAPLGEKSIEHLKMTLNYPTKAPFEISKEVYEHYDSLIIKKQKNYEAWLKMFQMYQKDEKELFNKLQSYYKPITLDAILSIDNYLDFEDKDDATRNSSGLVLNRLKDNFPNLIGGSADLASSNKTLMKGEGRFSSKDYKGRNLYYGIRELAMTAIANGIILYGGLKAYTATFFVFVDYMKPMLRLSAIMGIGQIAVLTHDSIGVGEDGPTHQPIEQLSMLRSTPNTVAFRPADAKETAYGWALALSSENTPHVLVLSRQNLPQLAETGEGALKGGYILYETNPSPDIIYIASGSEVFLTLEAAKAIEKDGKSVRVISMPSVDIFETQSQAYKEEVLPGDVTKRVIVEAASALSWYRYGTPQTRYVCIDCFGESAPAAELFEHFDITVENILKQSRDLYHEI